MQYREILEKLIQRENLGAAAMTEVMDAVMDGACTPAQVAGLLVALRMKGETIEEVAAAAASMRRHATPVDAGGPPVVDIVGTGGDGAHTFNVSTAAMFIAAGAGVKLAKHGNRSVSSKCGSADVLKALGVNIELPADRIGACVQEVGVGFLFAPMLHGAMKHAIGPRRELQVRTIFNMLGPLTNPAGANALVLGVFDAKLTDVYARVLRELGTDRAMVVHGKDGLDEITGTDNTLVVELKGDDIESREFDPRPYMGEYCTAADLKGGEPEDNAQIIKDLLVGADGPKRNVALMNAAAGIYVEGIVETFEQAFELASASVDDGKAKQKLDELVAFTNR